MHRSDINMNQVTIAVLGGSGFLGQHVVAELVSEAQQKGTPPKGSSNGSQWFVKEIKVLDIKPYEPVVGESQEAIPVAYRKCDIQNLEQLRQELTDVTAVVNCAAVTPDYSREDLGCSERMRGVNLDGVKNLVRVCQEVGVRALVHTSTVAVKVGGQRLIEHTETLSPSVSDNELILGDYARGRLKAEKEILAANGSSTSTGGVLQTVVLQPPLLYGEGDPAFVPHILRLARAGGDRLPSVGNPEAFLQAAYVGNVAVAHVYALRKMLMERSEEIDKLQNFRGLNVYVTDDTPPNNLPALVSPFVSHLGLKPSHQLSYWTVSLFLTITSIFALFFSFFGYKTRSDISCHPTWTLHKLAGTITVVSRLRASLSMGYKPKYEWQEALERANSYYTRVLTASHS